METKIGNYEVVTARSTTQTLHKVEQNKGNHVGSCEFQTWMRWLFS